MTIGSTGPKISSRMIRMSCVTPVRTVGAMKCRRDARHLDAARRSRRCAPLRDRVVDQLADQVELLLRDHRPDLGVPFERVADRQAPRPLRTTPSMKRSGDLVHDVGPLDARARLAGVGEAAPHGAGDRVGQVGVGAHDLRVLAAQLEHRALHPPRALLADAAPDLDRAREEDLAGARLDQRLAHRAAAVHRPQEALGQRRRARTPPGCAGRSAASATPASAPRRCRPSARSPPRRTGSTTGSSRERSRPPRRAART